MNHDRLVLGRSMLWRRVVALALVLAAASAVGLMAIEYSLFLPAIRCRIAPYRGGCHVNPRLDASCWRTPDSSPAATPHPHSSRGA
jgi:hypothetical protein